jgi:hypothetical protein
MLEVGVIWLLNQYRRDLVTATISEIDLIPATIAESEGAFIHLENEQVNANLTTKNKISNDLWLGDSGASCHMTNSDEGMYNCRDIKSPIKIGDGRTLYATKIGMKKLVVIQKDGSTLDIILDECKYVPGLWINLFSITKAVGNKWNLSNKGQSIVLSKNKTTLMFDRLMQTDNGAVVGVIMKPKIDTMHLSIEKGRVVDINDFHKSMGHINEESLRKTALFYNIKLKVKLDKCYECSISKIKQRNVAKTTENKSEIPGERLFIDISSIKKRSFSGSKYWVLVLDDYSDMYWSIFIPNKSDMPEKVVALLKKLRSESKGNVRHTVRKVDVIMPERTIL